MCVAHGDARNLARFHEAAFELAGVDMLLALDSDFDIEFPDRMLGPRVFGSVATPSEAVAELVAIVDMVPSRLAGA